MSAFRNRAQGGFKPFDTSSLATDNYERVYQTHTPKSDSDYSVTFDIRTPHDCHMGTVVYLERSLRFRVEYKPLHDEGMFFGVDTQYRDPVTNRSPYDVDIAGNIPLLNNSPGFSLQNCMEHFEMRFKDTTAIDKPNQWLAMYSHLYPHSLRNYVRGSSGAFLTERLISGTTLANMIAQRDRMAFIPLSAGPPAGHIMDAYEFQNPHNYQTILFDPPLEPHFEDFDFDVVSDTGANGQHLLHDISRYNTPGNTQDLDIAYRNQWHRHS